MTYRRTDTDPETVERLTFVLFAEDGMAYGSELGFPIAGAFGQTVWIDP